MPTTIFDWIVRTAMLVMAGLVTLSILGSIAAMTNDPGTGFATGERPVFEGERVRERQASPVPAGAEEGDAAVAESAPGPGAAGVAARPAAEDKEERWLEAIAYALLAVAGVGALAVLMLANLVRELRRIGRSPPP